MPRNVKPDLDMSQINIDAEEAGLTASDALIIGAQRAVKRALRGSGIKFTSDVEYQVDKLIDDCVHDVQIDIQNLVYDLLTGN